MTEQLPSDQEVSPTKIEWPQSKGDPIRPVWSYAQKKGMYEAEALRMMAHDLVQRLKELELPLHKAMKEAAGDGLTEMAYIKMMTRRLNNTERENYRLERRIEELERALCVAWKHTDTASLQISHCNDYAVLHDTVLPITQKRAVYP